MYITFHVVDFIVPQGAYMVGRYHRTRDFVGHFHIHPHSQALILDDFCVSRTFNANCCFHCRRLRLIGIVVPRIGGYIVVGDSAPKRCGCLVDSNNWIVVGKKSCIHEVRGLHTCPVPTSGHAVRCRLEGHSEIAED